MLQRFCLASLILLIAQQNANCAMKKSWKSAANFDTDIPKFTPFGFEGGSINKAKEDYGAIKVETTPTTAKPTSPSPSAETLASKLSSKIKAPAKHIANVYSMITKQANKQQDFGNFEADMAQDYQPHIPVKSYSEAEHEADRNQIDISQILNDLAEENDKEHVAHDSLDSEDDIEFHENKSTNSTQYKLGSLVNVTVVDETSDDSLVNVNVDQQKLKEIFTGRGKKNGILERVVPLFILPFLIQSAIVPFIVTMIKLFLMKSLFAGKIAILLLLLGALKNHQTGMYMKSMQHSPYNPYKDYPSPFPERRIESNFEGYKVEGKPEAVVH